MSPPSPSEGALYLQNAFREMDRRPCKETHEVQELPMDVPIHLQSRPKTAKRSSLDGCPKP